MEIIEHVYDLATSEYLSTIVHEDYPIFGKNRHGDIFAKKYIDALPVENYVYIDKRGGLLTLPQEIQDQVAPYTISEEISPHILISVDNEENYDHIYFLESDADRDILTNIFTKDFCDYYISFAKPELDFFDKRLYKFYLDNTKVDVMYGTLNYSPDILSKLTSYLESPLKENLLSLVNSYLPNICLLYYMEKEDGRRILYVASND